MTNTVSEKTAQLTFDHNFGSVDQFSIGVNFFCQFLHWQIPNETVLVSVIEILPPSTASLNYLVKLENSE